MSGVDLSACGSVGSGVCPGVGVPVTGASSIVPGGLVFDSVTNADVAVEGYGVSVSGNTTGSRSANTGSGSGSRVSAWLSEAYSLSSKFPATVSTVVGTASSVVVYNGIPGPSDGGSSAVGPAVSGASVACYCVICVVLVMAVAPEVEGSMCMYSGSNSSWSVTGVVSIRHGVWTAAGEVAHSVG